MTTETRMRAVNEVVKATGGHDTMSTLSVDELKDVTHTAALQTQTDTALNSQTDIKDVTHTAVLQTPTDTVLHSQTDIKDVTHRAVLQTRTDIALNSQTDISYAD